MFSELAGSGSLLFCQNKDDVTALPVSLCPNFSFLPSTCLSPFPSAPSVKFGNVSEGYYLRDSMSLQFLPKSERDPAGAHTGGVASHYIHSSQVLQSFAAFCAVIFCSLSNREAKHPFCVAIGMERETGRAWRDYRGAGCRRWSSAAGLEVELRTGSTSRQAEDVCNMCEYGSLSW